jgi:hypothetical protein
VSGTACDTLGRCDECFLHELENGLGVFDCGGPDPREPITYCVDAGGDIRDRARAACEACLGGVCTEVLCEGGLGFTREVEGVSIVYMHEAGCALPGQVWSNVAGQVTHTF